MRPGAASMPRTESFAVFAFTVAEALAHIALGRESPGTYTLTAVPPWSWREVHLYYAERANVRAEIVEAPVREVHRRAWLAPAWRLAVHQRELLHDLAYRWWPAIAERARATYLKRRARADVQGAAPEPWRPYIQDKRVPGRRLTSLSDSRSTMHEDTRRVEELLATLV